MKLAKSHPKAKVYSIPYWGSFHIIEVCPPNASLVDKVHTWHYSAGKPSFTLTRYPYEGCITF